MIIQSPVPKGAAVSGRFNQPQTRLWRCCTTRTRWLHGVKGGQAQDIWVLCADAGCYLVTAGGQRGGQGLLGVNRLQLVRVAQPRQTNK